MNTTHENMRDIRLRVRANRALGELEVEGSEAAVGHWWDKLWSELALPPQLVGAGAPPARHQQVPVTSTPGSTPETFGEFYSEFRSDITDIDKMLIAGAFLQKRDPERIFSTKTANQLLLDQNVKLANASQSARRLVGSKKAFVVSDGKFRISTVGLEHLDSLKSA